MSNQFPVDLACLGQQVEVLTVLDSEDSGLRGRARATLDAVASSQFQGIVIIQSAQGGGAPEFARYLAVVACRARKCRLFSTPIPENAAGQVALVSLRQTAARVLPTATNLVVGFSTDDSDSAGFGAVNTLRIPPISRRPKDAVHAARILVAALFPPGLELAADALELIRDFRWPGDLAHMRVTLGLVGQRAFASNASQVDAAQILEVLQRKELNLADLCRIDQAGWGFPVTGKDLFQLATFTGFSRVKRALEMLLIAGAVSSTGGNSVSAARRLRLPYTTLVSRQKTLGSLVNGA